MKELAIVVCSTLIIVAFTSWIDLPIVSAVPLQDRGNVTYDPNTNFEWLDIVLTSGISPNAALSGFGSYVTAEGFRIASQTEVFQLFLDAGLTAVDAVERAADYLDAQSLVALLGATAGTASQGWSVFSSVGPTYIEPFVQFNPVTVSGRAYPGGAMNSGNAAIAGVGVFLVRQAVPEPASFLLLGLGMLCVARYARRFHRL